MKVLKNKKKKGEEDFIKKLVRAANKAMREFSEERAGKPTATGRPDPWVPYNPFSDF